MTIPAPLRKLINLIQRIKKRLISKCIIASATVGHRIRVGTGRGVLSPESLKNQRPWQKSKIQFVSTGGQGMLRPVEGNMLYFLARDYYAGVGEIVDAGAFLGASARNLASGLKHNLRVKNKNNRIHSFDKFRADEKYIFNYITKNAGEFIDFGSSFRGLFQRNLGELIEFVDVSEGDFLSKNWTGGPIEILFIDISKTIALNSHLVKIFFPALIPGRSILVHQDYHHPHCPYIHVTMAYFSDYFEIIEEKADDSVAYLYVDDIPSEHLQRVVEFDFSASEQINLMDKAIELLSPANRNHVELAKVRLLIDHDLRSEAQTNFDKLIAQIGRDANDEHWGPYAGQVESLFSDRS